MSGSAVKKVEDEFRAIDKNKVKYDLFKFNCAQFVARGLRAGGIDTGPVLIPNDYDTSLQYQGYRRVYP